MAPGPDRRGLLWNDRQKVCANGRLPPHYNNTSGPAATAANRVIERQQHHRSHERYEDAPQVEAGHAVSTKRAEYDAADEGADYTQDNVKYHALARPVHHQTGQPSGH